MIPLTVTMTGAIGIRAGLKRESITIDLESVPDDAVSVAIRGDNGMGKSTLLNLGLTPWREPEHVDDVYAQFGPEGRRVLEFEHDGRRYRSDITIKQTAKTKSMKSSLHVHTDDAGWQPYTMPDGTTSDGKNTTYDACLEHLLGPRSLYYMSAFRHQGARPLASHPDPKSLMRALLALDEPEQLADKAKTVTRELRRALEARRGDIERIEQLEHRLKEIGPELEREQARIPDLLAAHRSADDAVADARRRHEEARNATEANADVRRQHQSLAERLAQVRRQTAGQLEQIDADISRARQQLDDANRASARLPLVEAAERDAAEHQTQIQKLETQRAEVQADADKYHEADAAVARLQAELTHVTTDGKRLAASCDDLRRRHGYVEQVPCKGADEFAECPALKDAVAAGSRLPEEEKARDAKRDQWTDIDRRLKSAMQTRAQLAAAREQVLAIDGEIRETRAKLDEARQLAAQRESVEQAAKQVESLRQTLGELRQRFERTETQGRDDTAAIQQEINALPPLAPADATIAAAAALDDAMRAANAAAQAVEQANARVAGLEAERNTTNRQLEQVAKVRAEVDRLNTEISEWTLLSASLLGVIDLSIEDAGPAIAAHANHLLREAYGPRFTCRIVTQKQQANGKLVETFDISVIDAETGIESSILRKSGGETVWLDKAMRDAVGLYHQEAAGVHYECLFADEAEDGLTQERKEQFYRMDRAALALGGYRRKFFISHNPQAWEMADHVIDLADYNV